MSFFGQTKRGAHPSNKSRRTPPLPLSTNDVVQEKFATFGASHGLTGGSATSSRGHLRSSSFTQPLQTASTPNGWFTVIYIPLPSFLSRRSEGGSGTSSSGPSGGNGRNRSDSLTQTLSGGGASYEARNNYLANGGRYHPANIHHTAHTRQPSRHIPLYLPIPRPIWTRLPGTRRPTPLRLCFLVFIVVGAIVIVLGFKKNAGGGTTWSPPFQGDPSTLVLTKEEVARIWQWEVMSGHHPSVKQVPESVPIPQGFPNPAVPASLLSSSSKPAHGPMATGPNSRSSSKQGPLVGTGAERTRLPIKTPIPPWEEAHQRHLHRTDTGFPPRPVPGSIADLDLILERCDFSTNQYVRDCLELLRIGANLDNGRRFRRHNISSYEYIFDEDPSSAPHPHHLAPTDLSRLMVGKTFEENKRDPLDDPATRREKSLSRSPLKLPAPMQPGRLDALQSGEPCDSRYPRIFHMFWAGPFTDKPYMAVMSFLFTQNLGLDLPLEKWSDNKDVCRPQFWVWINPGPAAAVPNPSAKREMYESLALNPWSAPFLHSRFKDVVKFKMWNTTEQLDGIDELRDHWRTMPIFNSGGNKYEAPKPAAPEAFVERDIERNASRTLTGADGMLIVETEAAERAEGDTPPTSAAPVLKKGKGGLFEKVGSSSESDYDRLSVILSDMARFVLTHRYGGIYLDADTLFLRDWEELWNWKGQFAYRWSWHQKYNTAVLKLHRNSALSSFLFKTALENGLDFHPMTVSRYLKDADLDPLLFRIPDALFDPAWLNMEKYQRDRPPFPYFPEFNEFFSNNRFSASGPHPLGFDGFFRGAFSYHFHNFWWLPFDPSRNWPDLGPRFIKGERLLRDAARAAKILQDHPEATDVDIREHEGHGHDEDDFEDESDLSWSTALKRTFEAYVRGERPNAYGEWLRW